MSEKVKAIKPHHGCFSYRQCFFWELPHCSHCSKGLKFFDSGYSAALAIVFVLVMTLITVGFLKMRDKMEAEI